MGATSYPERLKIEKLSQKGLTDREIAGQLGLSIPTVRKWRRRLKRGGKACVLSRMGRPKRGAMSTYPSEMVKQLESWCRQHPGWGAKTLCTELLLSETFGQQRLPSRATLSRWLKEHGEVRLYEKHSQLPEKASCSTQACHEEWEMDARGYSRVPNLGLVSLIDINDVYSQVKLLSYPCCLGQKRVERYPSTVDYQLALRLAFAEWGLPDRLATDHDRIFFDETTKSPFPTRFHLWLIALGVDLQFGRLNRPTDQAITERSHQTWDSQVLQGAVFECYQSLWLSLQQRKIFLNEHLPSHCRLTLRLASLAALTAQSGKPICSTSTACLISWPRDSGSARSAPLAPSPLAATSITWAMTGALTVTPRSPSTPPRMISSAELLPARRNACPLPG